MRTLRIFFTDKDTKKMYAPRNEILEKPVFPKNWESDIEQVFVEPCDEQEDPLGYRAVFFLDKTKREALKSFAVGASYLAKRRHNLSQAGYDAPMTHRAIDLVEEKIGSSLMAAA